MESDCSVRVIFPKLTYRTKFQKPFTIPKKTKTTYIFSLSRFHSVEGNNAVNIFMDSLTLIQAQTDTYALSLFLVLVL